MGKLLSLDSRRAKAPGKSSRMADVASAKIEIDQEMESFGPFRRLMRIEQSILAGPLLDEKVPEWHPERVSNSLLAMHLIDTFSSLHESSKTSNDLPALNQLKNALRLAKKELLTTEYFSRKFRDNYLILGTVQGWIDEASKALTGEVPKRADLAMVILKPKLEEQLHQLKFLDGRLPEAATKH